MAIVPNWRAPVYGTYHVNPETYRSASGLMFTGDRLDLLLVSALHKSGRRLRGCWWNFCTRFSIQCAYESVCEGGREREKERERERYPTALIWACFISTSSPSSLTRLLFNPIPLLNTFGHLWYMGGCQNYGPFLGPLNIRCRIRIGIIILTTTHFIYPYNPYIVVVSIFFSIIPI